MSETTPEGLHYVRREVMFPNDSKHELNEDLEALKQRIEYLENKLKKFDDLEYKFEILQKQINDIERDVWRIGFNNCTY